MCGIVDVAGGPSPSAGTDPDPEWPKRSSGAALDALTVIDGALCALDRLEIRCRDSAGRHVLRWGTGEGAGEESASLGAAADDGPRPAASVVDAGDGRVGFTYRAAAEEPGDNAAHLRRMIADDSRLHRAIGRAGARVTVVGHTRWTGTVPDGKGGDAVALAILHVAVYDRLAGYRPPRIDALVAAVTETEREVAWDIPGRSGGDDRRREPVVAHAERWSAAAHPAPAGRT
ncbi:MAG: hypothetical protein QOG43_1107 [Actinomycetota bacterium]|jgi:hypothetical protein|nr:hypothetical protein [Actinomycetota bacterium]